MYPQCMNRPRLRESILGVPTVIVTVLEGPADLAAKRQEIVTATAPTQKVELGRLVPIKNLLIPRNMLESAPKEVLM
jgi:hypothetical protein